MATKDPGYGQIDRDYASRLATTPPADDGPLWMVNLMKYRLVADYGDDDGTAAAAQGLTGQEADDRYAPLDSLAAVGARPVFFGTVEQQLLGEDVVWDRVGVVRYPTRRSFIDMQARPEFREAHRHKEAGMDRTMAVATDPARLVAQQEHREAAIADTYTMIVRPQINELAASI